MTTALDSLFGASSNTGEARLSALIQYLRKAVFARSGQTELLHAVFLDSHRSFVGDETLGRGEIAALSLRMRDLFSRALATRARGLILAHNHPSGMCQPSAADIVATQRLVTVGKALDIELIDHLIITRNSVYSMRAGGDL